MHRHPLINRQKDIQMYQFFVLSQCSVGRLPVSNVQGYSMHRESLALTSMLSCKTGLPQECCQNPNGYKNKMEGQHCMP